MDLPPVLEGLKQVLEDLVTALGIPCEVVLHDLRDPSHSIVAIAGDITGRPVGGPATDLVLRLLRSQETDHNPIAYLTTTPSGIPLRSSTIFVRDERGDVVGCLCTNIDLTHWRTFLQLASHLCETRPISAEQHEPSESFEIDITDVLKATVQRGIQRVGLPVSRLRKKERIDLVRLLDFEGVFAIRGAVDYVADALCVSRPTLYNYLAELRNAGRFN